MAVSVAVSDTATTKDPPSLHTYRHVNVRYGGVSDQVRRVRYAVIQHLSNHPSVKQGPKEDGIRREQERPERVVLQHYALGRVWEGVWRGGVMRASPH